MDGIVAILANLTLQGPVAASDSGVRTVGSVSQDICNDLQPTRVAEPTEDERNVSSYVSVLVTQPVHHGREHTRVVTIYDCLCDWELPPKDLLALKLLDQCGG